MDCKQCTEDITAFLDGELSAAESELVRSHLSICASCAEELRSLREAADFIESHKRELEPRAGSWNLVRARISTADSPSLLRFFAPNRWRVALASLVLIAALALGYQQYQQIQKRSLDQYISQYVRDREARRQQQNILSASEASPKMETPYADNPFIEIRATSTDNPFQSEDR